MKGKETVKVIKKLLLNMEEILRELIKSTAEKGVQKQFYSNLTVTTPLHEYSQVHEVISKGISYLESVCNEKTGFQSQKYTSRECHERIEEKDEESNFEVYSSTLILDLLGDIPAESQINVSSPLLWKLKEFIAPDFGIGSFNMFKRTRNPDLCSEEEKDEDSDGKIESDENEKDLGELPDDCNTTSLAIWVLLREKILERKPAESLAQLLLANGNEENGEGVIQTFLPPRGSKNNCEQEGCLEPVVCANVMRLLYQLEMNYEGTSEATEDFLYETLENASFSPQDHDQTIEQEDQYESVQLPNASALVIPNHLHNSPDAFLYFLSRAVTISPKAKTRFWNLIAESLYDRIDTTDYPLDIAMRILTADELGLLIYDNQIRKAIVTDYEKLLNLQNDDGSWPPDSLWKFADTHYGGKEITTAFACKAIDSFYCANKLRKINKKISMEAFDF